MRQETIGGAAGEEVNSVSRADAQVDLDDGSGDENGIGDGSSGGGPVGATAQIPPARFGAPTVSDVRERINKTRLRFIMLLFCSDACEGCR